MESARWRVAARSDQMVHELNNLILILFSFNPINKEVVKYTVDEWCAFGLLLFGFKSCHHTSWRPHSVTTLKLATTLMSQPEK